MGRITIFTAEHCPYCRRVESAFTARGIPYVTISITKYPQKRNDMIVLSQHRSSTPQVFFNTRHVGGMDDTLALLEEWDADPRYKSAYHRFQQEIEQHFDPSNPRFQLPEETQENYRSQEDEQQTETKEAKGSKEKNEDDFLTFFREQRGADRHCIQLPWSSNKSDNNKTILEMTQLLQEILPIQDTTKRLTVHRNVFCGKDAFKPCHVIIKCLSLWPKNWQFS